MSAIRMTKRCVHCHRTYTYNPSAGDMGGYCKHCGYAQRFSPALDPQKVPRGLTQTKGGKRKRGLDFAQIVFPQNG